MQVDYQHKKHICLKDIKKYIFILFSYALINANKFFNNDKLRFKTIFISLECTSVENNSKITIKTKFISFAKTV